MGTLQTRAIVLIVDTADTVPFACQLPPPGMLPYFQARLISP